MNIKITCLLQVCHIEMILGKTDANNVVLVADEFILEQQANMNLFFITERRLVNMTNPRKGVRMELKFKRKVVSEMMTTYRVKVNFLARCGQKSDLSGLCGIGYWVWIISTAHCKQPILIGY